MAFRSRALWGQIALSGSYALFLFAITELVGYNLLRIVFAVGTFTTFSLMVLGLLNSARLRSAGVILLLILIWSNLLHMRYFGTTLQLGSLYNIGFLPSLGSQIVELMRGQDLLLLATAVAALYGLQVDLWPALKDGRKASTALLLIYVMMVLFQLRVVTEPQMAGVRSHGGNQTRLTLYRSVRFGAVDHAGSILQFGLTWRYFVDYLQLTSGRDLHPIPAEPWPKFAADAERPNIVVIQVEALDRAIINYEFEGEAVTPFLNRLAAEHLQLTGIYAQHSSGGGTSDADFSFLTSLYPLGYKSSLAAVGLDRLPSLPRIMDANGFATIASHGNSGSFYYRQQAYGQLGFERWYLKEQLQVADPDRWHGLRDDDYLDQMATILEQTREPFFAFQVTLSSHSPFDRLTEADFLHRFTHRDGLAARYFATMRYVDSALEKFYSRVIAAHPGTLFLIYGDHTSTLMVDGYEAFERGRLEPVAVIFADPRSSDPRVVSVPGSTIDLAPTLLDILGLDQPSFWQGQSLLRGRRTSPVLFVQSQSGISAAGERLQFSESDTSVAPLLFTRKYLR